MTRDQLRMIILDLALTYKSGQRFAPGNIIHEKGPISEKVSALRGSPITQAELLEASLAFHDLLNAGFITYSPTNGQWNWYEVTPSGKDYLDAGGNKPFLSVDLRDIIGDADILTRAEPNYLNGDFDLAVFAAFKTVEEKLRAKAGLDATLYGVELVTKALHPSKGVLEYPHAQTQSEREALHLLFLGAVGAYKNPSSHRTVAYSDSTHALQTICLADLLLKYVSELNPRSASA